MPKILAPLHLPAVENESGDVLTSSGTLLSKRTATEILADIGAAAASHNHSISEVTGLQSALDGKAASSHSHTISNITGLQSALDGKAASSHTHSIGNVTGLQSALDGKANLTGGNTFTGVQSFTHSLSIIGGSQYSLTVGGMAANIIRKNNNTGSLTVTGGETAVTGARVLLYGGDHTYSPNIGWLSAGSSHVLTWNPSGVSVTGTFKVNDNDVLTSLPPHSHAIGEVTGLQNALDGKAATSHNHNLDSLSNVTITSNTNGEILRWNGSAWINNTLSEAGIAAASHTHTIANVSGLQTALDGKSDTGHTHSLASLGAAAASHSHSISDVTGLQGALDGKASTSHSHAISDVTGLQTALDGKAASSHNHSTSNITSGTFSVARGGTGLATLTSGSYLRGNGTSAVTMRTPAQVLSDIGAAAASHSHAIADVTGLQSALDGKASTSHNHSGVYAPVSHSHSISNVTGLQSALDARATLAGGNTFSGAQVFSGNVSINTSAGYVMSDNSGLLSTVPKPYAEKEPFMVNPLENGEYYIVISASTTLDIPNAVTRGTGTATYSRSTDGTSFSTITTSTGFNTNDVLMITVTGMSEEDYFAITIPQLGGGYDYEPLIFNPSEEGYYFVTMDGDKSYDLGNLHTRGTGSVTFSRSTDGTVFNPVSGNTAFNANDVLMATVAGMTGDYYAFTIQRTA